MNDNQNLKDIFNTIKKNYKKFSLYSFVSALIFYIMTFTITPIYVSKATILPVDDELSLQQNLFSAVGLGQNSKSKTYFEAFAIAQSKDFIWKFINQQNLQDEIIDRAMVLPEIFSSEKNYSKDFQTNTFLKEFLYVDDRSKDNVIILNIKSTSGEKSQILLENYIAGLREEIANRKLGTEKNLIKNLKKQMDIEIDVKIKSLITELIEQKEAEIKINENKLDFIFKVIDSPSSPIKPDSPRRALFALAGLIVGFLFLYLIIIREKN